VTYELDNTQKAEAIKKFIFNRELSLAVMENLPESAVEEINRQIDAAKRMLDELS
jgi:hypothetical protein